VTSVIDPVAPATDEPDPARAARRFRKLVFVLGGVFVVLFGGYVWMVFESHPRNPVIATDYADPYVQVVGDTYYAFGTGVGDDLLQVRSSTNLKDWERLPNALPKLPSWAVGGQAWAPTVQRFGDTWVVYFSAAIDYEGTQCIHLATASHVVGPYTPVPGDPFLCNPNAGGVIDPSIYRRGNDVWLLWKTDGDHIDKPTALWSQPLTPNGRAFADGSIPSRLISDSMDWQDGIVEAPYMVHTDHGYRLFFSSGWYNTDKYSVGWATCDSPTGPCRVPAVDNPFVASTDVVAGPGGASIFTDAVGDHWIVYHGWNPTHIGYENGGVRSMRVDRIDLSGEIPSTPAPTP